MTYLEKAYQKADQIRSELRHPYIGTEHLFLAIMGNDKVKKFLKEYNITYDKFRKKLVDMIGYGSNEKTEHDYKSTPLFDRVEGEAIIIAEELDTEINPMILLLAIFNEGEGVAIRILIELGADVVSMRDALEDSLTHKSLDFIKKFDCLYDMCEQVKEDDVLVTGLDEELNTLLHNLLRLKKPNTILIGEPGVGKTALVEKLAQAINNKEVPKFLQNLKVIQLSLAQAVAGTKYRGEFEDKLTRVIKAIENRDDVVLFIDEVHTLNGAGGAEGAIDAGNIFKPVLARGKVKMIGATTTAEYEEYIKKDKALTRRFNVITMLEPKKNETIEILNKAKEKYEKHFSIKISDKDIEKIYVESTHKTGRMPDIALDTLEEFSVNKYFDKQEKQAKKKESETVCQ